MDESGEVEDELAEELEVVAHSSSVPILRWYNNTVEHLQLGSSVVELAEAVDGLADA